MAGVRVPSASNRSRFSLPPGWHRQSRIAPGAGRLLRLTGPVLCRITGRASALTAFCPRRHGIGQGATQLAPGQEMQHDTSPHDLHLGGRVGRAQTAGLVLGYSADAVLPVLPAVPSLRVQALSPVAFRYMDGVCPICLIDNTHVVVLKGTGRAMIPVPEMAAFAERFGLTFVALTMGDTNRSGRVERSSHVIERGVLPGRRFTDCRADANRQARAWCDRVNQHPKRHLKATPRRARSPATGLRPRQGVGRAGARRSLW